MEMAPSLDTLGDGRRRCQLVDCDLPTVARLQQPLIDLHMWEMWECLGHLAEERPDGVSADFKWIGEMAIKVSEAGLPCRAGGAARHGRDDFDAGMADIDMILTPSAKDVALEGLAVTGDPLFCRNWSSLGVPSLAFPAAWDDGLPIGLQFVGRAGTDRTMLATAAKLLERDRRDRVDRCVPMNAMTLDIRTATSSDLAQLLELYRHLNPDDVPASITDARAIFAQFTSQPGNIIFAGFIGDALVTSCTLITIPNLTRRGTPYALIENVVTHEGHRGVGYGQAVLQGRGRRGLAGRVATRRC